MRLKRLKKLVDIRDVMNYDRDFSLFFSAVELKVFFDICYKMGVRDFLVSYEYLRKKENHTSQSFPDARIFVDSGAFTYQVDQKYQNYTVGQWEKQIEDYLTWVEKHKKNIFAIAELDLQNLVGLATVNRWRDVYFEPFMLRTGIPVCFVLHGDDRLWEPMCERYPYVGISFVGEDIAYEKINQYLKIAEKYNSLVHGFGLSKIPILTKLPFYTVDSTSWNAGVKFNEISIWTGKNARRFTIRTVKTHINLKQQHSAIRKYVAAIKDERFDIDKILDCDFNELVRACVYAYQKAEQYVKDCLKPLQYWRKARLKKIDLSCVTNNFYPSVDFILSNYDEKKAKAYAKNMNINPEYPQLRDILQDVTTFCTWCDTGFTKLQEIYLRDENFIAQLHKTYINRVVNTVEEQIEDLITFFRDCVAGNNSKLLYLGTVFDKALKERDEYIEDDEEVYLVDVPKEDILDKLRNVLPATSEEFSDNGTFDIDSMDDEIFSNLGIIPAFDENGKFLKGQKQIHKPKKVYSKKYPKLVCSTCFSAARCPEFKDGYVCAYAKMFNRFNTRNVEDIKDMMHGYVTYGQERLEQAMIAERLSGGIDAQIDDLMDKQMQRIEKLQKLTSSLNLEIMEQTRIYNPNDGTVIERNTLTNPREGGILSKLFSPNVKSKESIEDVDEVIDVPATKKGKIYEEIEEGYTGVGEPVV